MSGNKEQSDWEKLVRWEPSFVSETKYIDFRIERDNLKEELEKSGSVTVELLDKLKNLIRDYKGDPDSLLGGKDNVA